MKKRKTRTSEKPCSSAWLAGPAQADKKFFVQERDAKETRVNPRAGWRHPGGKLRELGAETLSDAELLSILVSTGITGKPAERIAEEILAKFGSFRGMANQPLDKLMEIKGLADVKVIRIAATFEIARRIVNEVLEANER